MDDGETLGHDGQTLGHNFRQQTDSWIFRLLCILRLIGPPGCLIAHQDAHIFCVLIPK